MKNNQREQLFYSWKYYEDKLIIFGIEGVGIYGLAAIIQNDMIISKNELKNWYKKALSLIKILRNELKDESIILKNFDKLVKKTIMYFIKNKKVKNEKE